MANTHARKRRRRRTNWQAVFWMLILGIVIGVVLGIWLCANYDVLGAINQTKTGLKFEGGQQVIETYPPVIATMPPVEASEPTPEPVVPTPVPVEPTPVPVEPTPEPVEPTPVPVEPTPEPVEPTPEPVVPTPVPVEPTPEPVEPTPVPVEPTPVPVEPTPEPVEQTAAQDNGGFGLASSFGEGGDELADEEPDPVMTDESGNAITKDQYEAQGGVVPEDQPEADPSVQETVGDTQTEEPAEQQTTGTAVAAQPRPRTDPVLPQEWFVFETEINAEGMPYYGKDGAGTVVPLAVRVVDYMSPDDYAAQYADQYQLYGVEAAVAIEIRNDSAAVVIVPDNALGVVLRDKTDVPNDTYPLADAPMKASTDIAIGPGETVTVYKRYALDKIEGPYPFLSVAYMAGGETLRTYFLLDGME